MGIRLSKLGLDGRDEENSSVTVFRQNINDLKNCCHP